MKKKYLFEKPDGLRYHLSKRFIDKPNEFPEDSIKYDENFKNIEDYLNNNVHPEVVIGAALKGYGLLNDHGKEHVAMVINRAGMLLEEKVNDLTGFEIYLLLLAIHFHDVGNIYGRDKHEQRITDVMEELGDKLPLDNAVKTYIRDIAMTHGGKINDDNDTIGKLLLGIEHLNGKKIRPQIIAAILRFADEIAEDKTRAARFLLDVNEIPVKNEVFHHYSKHLDQPAIQGNDLILKFNISKEIAKNTIGKEDISAPNNITRVFLYDEIKKRIQKCFCELLYCNRFAYPFINVKRIKVTIKIYQSYRTIFEDGFTLQEKGYPNIKEISFNELIEKPLKAENGDDLKKILEEYNDKSG